MKLKVSIFNKKGWKLAILILPALFGSCQNSRTPEEGDESKASVYKCEDDYFVFTIGDDTFKSAVNDSTPVKWEYFNDERYDYDNFDMDCECQEFVLDEDDVHYFSFSPHSEKELEISIRKYWVNWSGHEFSPRVHDFHIKKLYNGPQVLLTYWDVERGCKYQSIQGTLRISRFKFGKCIEAEISAELESKDCGTIELSGKFSAHYTGLLRSE